MTNFKIPPISTLAGSTFPNFLDVLRHQKIEPRFYLKTLLTGIIIGIATPFHWTEELIYRKKIKNFKFKKPPLFILGHWRSGTTHLHNLLCQADDAGFVTTYNSLFPNNLSSQFLFKNFMQWNMPKKRPSDNVMLNVEYPQEDEFALGNLCPYSYYKFFYFPEKYKEFYQQFVRFKDAPPALVEDWKKHYRKLIIKAILNTGGERAIIKNPINTGRVDVLMEEFPSAKFIHILRNPYIVYLSTRKFFVDLMPTIWLHEVPESFIERMIIDVYKELYSDLLNRQTAFKKNQFIEIKFEEFETAPLPLIKKIYEELELGDFKKQETRFTNYLSSQKGYKKNNYRISQKEIEMINEHWSRYLSHWDYNLPKEIVVV